MDDQRSKAEIRERMLERRRSVGEQRQREASRAVCGRIMDSIDLGNVETVLLYCPAIDDYEIDPRTLLDLDEQCLSSRRLLLPKVPEEEGPLLLFELPDPPSTEESSLVDYCSASHDESPIEVGRFNVPEPQPVRTRQTEPSEIDLVFVPGVAFDDDGFRVGFGSGYYDRLLSVLPDNALTVGLCYDFQVIERCPRESHDRPVDWVISQSNAHDTRS